MPKNLKAGIVSITFRQFAYKNIIKAVKQTSLRHIEWGSDIHIPYNENEKARSILYETDVNELKSVSYASYYRLGQKQYEIFEEIISTARILKVFNIKVWGGIRNRNYLKEIEIADIFEDLLYISKRAKIFGINISIEPHYNSIIDNMVNAVWFIKLLHEFNSQCDNVFIYWQPDAFLTHEENINALKIICPYLSNIHVYAKDKENNRYPLSNLKSEWSDYIKTVRKNNNDNFHYFLIEFVKNDSVEQLVEDAELLSEILT